MAIPKIEPQKIDANLKSRPTRLHHAAWVTRDMEMTRTFYEDVLGLPLTACWIEKSPITGAEYCHTCFEIGDGGSIAFFDWLAERDKPTHGICFGFPWPLLLRLSSCINYSEL